jgi:hypothetical protein
MNPLSLLTKGRTIRGLKERAGAYKFLEKSALPDFSHKGAIPTTSHPAARDELCDALNPAAAPPDSKPGASQSLALPKVGFWARLARRIGNRFSSRRAGHAGAPSVQTELALDKVTVVRNDLRDEDLELLAVARKTKNAVPAGATEDHREKQAANR